MKTRHRQYEPTATTESFRTVEHKLTDPHRDVRVYATEYTRSEGDDFIDVAVHSDPDGTCRVYVADRGSVAISVGHMTLWVTPDQADRIADMIDRRPAS